MGWFEQMRIGCEERALAGLEWVARRRGQSEALPAHLATGIDGETAAFFHLRRKGYTVVARRWSSGDLPGDVDLIAWQGPMLCFVEVKTRTARDASGRDRRRLPQAQHPPPPGPPIRPPVAPGDCAAGPLRRAQRLPCAGEKKEFQHFEGAFGWSEREDYERR
jgi:putative endonuclease